MRVCKSFYKAYGVWALNNFNRTSNEKKLLEQFEMQLETSGDYLDKNDEPEESMDNLALQKAILEKMDRI